MLCVQISAFLYATNGKENLFLSHFYFVIQFLLLSYFFFLLFKDKFQKLTIKIFLIITLVALSIQYSLNPFIFFKFNELEVFLTSIPLIIYCSFHFYNLLSEKKKYYFFTVGLLIYLFGSTIVFLTANLAISMKSRYFSNKIFELNVYLYVVYQLYLFYELKTILFNKKAFKN